jgi:hypothetical protein
VVTRRFQNRPTGGWRGKIKQFAGGAIGEADTARRIDNDEAFDHALKQGGGAVSLFAQFLLTLDALLGELAQAFDF